jgi:hypothetical protein
MTDKLGPILIGLAYLALVVFIMVFCAEQASDFDEFSQYWGLFGTLVGVATGAIPGFFFKTQADKADQRAAAAEDDAKDASKRAEAYALAADSQKADEILDRLMP